MSYADLINVLVHLVSQLAQRKYACEMTLNNDDVSNDTCGQARWMEMPFTAITLPWIQFSYQGPHDLHVTSMKLQSNQKICHFSKISTHFHCCCDCYCFPGLMGDHYSPPAFSKTQEMAYESLPTWRNTTGDLWHMLGPFSGRGG